MKRLLLLVVALGLAPAVAAADAPDTATATVTGDLLLKTVSALDKAVFDAFNQCSDPKELRKHASYFAPDVEFYHDTGGVTWSRQEMLANTAKHACGHFRRELVPGTLEVFPVQDFGAIAQGTHRFCQLDTGRCDGVADFTIIWRQLNGDWQITRVLSYGHQPAG